MYWAIGVAAARAAEGDHSSSPSVAAATGESTLSVVDTPSPSHLVEQLAPTSRLEPVAATCILHSGFADGKTKFFS